MTDALVNQLINRLEQVEHRLADLEAERQIRELLSRYGHTADSRADDEYVNLWVDDGVIEVAMGGEGAYKDGLRFEGKQAITDFIADPQGHHRPGFYGRSLHVQCNPVITVDGDEAVARAYSILLQNTDGVDEVVSAGTSEWRFRREDGTWKIALRTRLPVGHENTAANLGMD